MLFSIANIEADTLEEIQSLERDTGKKIIAFKGFDVTPASLDAETLNSICALEQKLGLSLLAVAD